MRTAFRIVASLAALAVVVQIGFAGYGAFNAIDKADKARTVSKQTIEYGFDPHGALGTIIVVLFLLLLILALVSRVHYRTAGLLFGLGIVQMLLAWGASNAAWVGFFHGINAVAIAAIAGTLAGNEWREARIASAA